MRTAIYTILLLIMSQSLSAQNNFKQQQNTFERVKNAYAEKWTELHNKLSQGGFKDDFQVYINAYKKEGKLEIWIKDKIHSTYSLFRTYDFSAHSGVLGPKTKEGDLQTPEGSYFIDRFNPESRFYLSLGINYPNAVDLERSGTNNPGSDIYIHGDQVTVGCIPLTNDKIKEVYILAVEAQNSGQTQIPVHIYPFKMTKENMKRELLNFPQHRTFWKSLQTAYTYFDQYKNPG